MKKIYLSILGLIAAGAVSAQNSVTFQVDMSGQTVSGNGVHVAGDFQSEAGASGDWQPSETELTDPNNDDIYSVTVNIPNGRYEYKFINDNNWGAGEEAIPAVCQVDEGNGNSNRYLWISSDTVLPAIQFAGSAPAGMQFVKLKVDMRNQLTASSTPDVMGEFNGFSDYVQLYDPEMDSIYYNFVYWGGDTMTYKFRNTHDWNDAESVTDPACGGAGSFGNDRFINAASDVISMANCYGACGPCVAAPAMDTINVTIRVDLSYEKVCANPDTVDVTGAGASFGNWGAAPVIMTDADNDDIWEATLQLTTNTSYEYKFRTRIDGNVKWESSANRTLMISAANDTVLDVVCFEQAGACTGAAPFGPADVTFAVDMIDEVPGDTVWIIGSFTSPQWQDGAIPLEFTGQGAVFAATTEICPNNFQFKFVNGDVTQPTNEEFAGDTAASACNVSNGIGGYNRSIERMSANDTTIAFKFSTCEDFVYTPTGVDELNIESHIAVFPNPFKNELTVRSSNSGIATVQLSDLSGRLIAEVNGNGSNLLNINTESLGLTSGLYLINIIENSGAKTIVKVSAL